MYKKLYEQKSQKNKPELIQQSYNFNSESSRQFINSNFKEGIFQIRSFKEENNYISNEQHL